MDLRAACAMLATREEYYLNLNEAKKNMRTGAMVIGIVGGLMGCVIGIIAFAMGDWVSSSDANVGTIIKIVSVVVPLAGLIGAAIVRSRPLVGALLMIASAVAFAVLTDFGAFGYITIALLAIAGLFGLLGMRSTRPATA
jgi:hypothetical protein